MGAGVVLLDEPTANLDPAGARDVVRAVSALVEQTGATLVVVEHQHAAWEGLLDRAVELSHGRIVADGPFEQVARRRRVEGLRRRASWAMVQLGKVTLHSGVRTWLLASGHHVPFLCRRALRL